LFYFLSNHIYLKKNNYRFVSESIIEQRIVSFPKTLKTKKSNLILTYFTLLVWAQMFARSRTCENSATKI